MKNQRSRVHPSVYFSRTLKLANCDELFCETAGQGVLFWRLLSLLMRSADMAIAGNWGQDKTSNNTHLWVQTNYFLVQVGPRMSRVDEGLFSTSRVHFVLISPMDL